VTFWRLGCCLGLALVPLSSCEGLWTPDGAPELPAVAGAEVVASGFSRPGALVSYGGGFALVDEETQEVIVLSGDRDVEVLAEGFGGADLLAESGTTLIVSDSEDNTLWALADGGAEPLLLWTGGGPPAALDVLGDAVWFTVLAGESNSPALGWAALNGSGAELVTESLTEPLGLSATDHAIFVADAGRGEILSVAPEDGALSALAAPFEDPRDVRWDDGTLYFTARSPNWPGGGWLYSMGDAGDNTTQLSYSPPGIDRIVLTQDSIYWTSAQSITRVARDGGTYEVLATETRVGGFVVQDDRLLWTDQDRGQVLSIPLD